MGKTEFLVTLIIFNLFFVMFVVAIVVYINKYRLRKKQYLNEMRLKNEIHEKELLTMQIEIQQATMQQIGRELHDNIGQKLTLVSLYAQQLLHENKAEQVNNRIEQISQITNESLEDLRNLSRTLTDDNISNKDIVTLIDNEISKIKSLHKCKISFENNLKNSDLSFSHKNVLLRVIQEFIQNSMKHSECENIFIKLTGPEAYLWKLELKDDGKGFVQDAHKSNGIGLANIRKRAEIIGAEYELTTAPNKGTAITLKIKHPS